jgi:quercetin dioxygenase-like cupin family protein
MTQHMNPNMTRAMLATVLFALCFVAWLRSDTSTGRQAGAVGRIIPAGGGDHVVRRWGIPAAALINPDNAGSKDFVVITEALPPGERIPVHKHPHAEEIIFVQQGTATAIVGEVRQQVTQGAIVYVPRGEWHGMDNAGTAHVHVMGIFSAPGYHTYFSETSVPAGERIVPFSEQELKGVRDRFKNVIVFKEP